MLVIVACGSDDEDSAATVTAPRPADTATEPTERTEPDTEAAEATETAVPEETVTEPAPSPEDEPGGAGDAEPARTLALFTGRDGLITPPLIRVPSFIAVQVELRSADGRGYALTFDGETVRAGGPLSSRSIQIDGLRPGEAVIGTPSGGAGNRVRVEATAEPGP